MSNTVLAAYVVSWYTVLDGVVQSSLPGIHPPP